ncbi:MAG: hypothetical protein WBP08_11260 [Saprospiraceae bacterium]
MKKIILIWLSIYLAIIVFFYFDSTKDIQAKYNFGHTLQSVHAAGKGDLIVLKEKSKRKDIVSFFRVVEKMPDKSLRVQYGTFWPVGLEDKSFMFPPDNKKYSNMWVEHLKRDHTLFNNEIVTITPQELSAFKSKYFITTYTKSLGTLHTYPFPNNIYLTICMIIAILCSIKLNTYVKKSISMDQDIILWVVIFLSAIYFAGKCSGQMIMSQLYSLFLLKNLISFYGLYWILRMLKNKFLGMETIEYQVLVCISILVFGLCAEYMGGHMLLRLQLFLELNNKRLFSSGFRCILIPDYMASRFIYYSSWVYFALAYLISHSLTRMTLPKISN